MALGAPHAAAAAGAEMHVFKSPWCGCCTKWVDHMRAAGFAVQVTPMEDLSPAKTHFGVAPDLEACHTAVVDGYVIEGHVPAADVQRLLSERPKAAGLAVPGMPAGSPGMEQGGASDPYTVVLFDRAGGRTAYATY
ncbi:MAG: DUF411 domain-containing protein [Alphaproteobacteria bacterium]|nr:DUF411 domain-containing protein [Alphaproteobacteria bacterium]MCB9928423.1 DUF411 domain-containing protein [Alphaproteobacteria bacterium]